MTDKESALPVAGRGTGDAPAAPTASIAVLSDEDLDQIAGGKISQDAWNGNAQYTVTAAAGYRFLGTLEPELRTS